MSRYSSNNAQNNPEKIPVKVQIWVKHSRIGLLALFIFTLQTTALADETTSYSATSSISKILVQTEMATTIAANRCCSPPAKTLETPDGLLAMPRIIYFKTAPYPEQIQDTMVVNQVLLQLTIDEEGSVVESVVVETGGPAFDEAATKAAMQLLFEPAKLDGEPIVVNVKYLYEFQPPRTQEPEEKIIVKGKDKVDSKKTPDNKNSKSKTTEELPENLIKPVNFDGILKERGTGKPLAGVVITAEKGTDKVETFSSATGEFQFSSLKSGVWKVIIDESEYELFQTDEEVVKGKKTNVKYYLERNYYNEYGIKDDFRYETKENRTAKEVNRQTLTITEIQRVPGNNGDATKVVQNLPGVARSAFGLGTLVVRGSAPEDSLVFLEGIEIPLLYHFGGLVSVINSDLLESIDFYPGSFSVKYGNAIGGIVDVSFREPNRDLWHGYIDADIFDATLLLEGPITEDLSIAFSTRRSYIDTLLPAILPDSVPLDFVTYPRYYDYQLAMSYHPSGKNNVMAVLYGSDDELVLERKGIDDENPNIRGRAGTDIFFHRFLFKWDHIFSSTISNQVVFNVGFDHLAFNAFDNLSFNLDFVPITLRDTLELELADWMDLEIGLDMSMLYATITAVLPPLAKEGETGSPFGTLENVKTSRKTFNAYPALFAELSARPVSFLTIIPGVRLAYFTDVEDVIFEPRLTILARILDGVVIKGGVGLFQQSPAPDELSADFGNPDLLAEKSIHYSLGTELAITEFMDLEVTGFYKNMFDLVSRSNKIIEKEGEMVPEVYHNQGIGRSYGMEFLLRHKPGNKFFGWISYTLSRSERKDDDQSEYRLFSFDQTHILTVVASYQLPWGLEAGLRFRYGTGNPTTPIAGATYLADQDFYARVPDSPLSKRNKNFHQLDLRLDKRFVFDKAILSVYLDVQNVYYAENEEGTIYNYDFSDSRPLTSLPIVPSIGIKGEF